MFEEQGVVLEVEGVLEGRDRVNDSSQWRYSLLENPVIPVEDSSSGEVIVTDEYQDTWRRIFVQCISSGSLKILPK
jgi:hypothetical protein